LAYDEQTMPKFKESDKDDELTIEYRGGGLLESLDIKLYGDDALGVDYDKIYIFRAETSE
jgi:hypothetical protein